MFPLQGALVWFLVREVRPCKPRSMAKKKKKQPPENKQMKKITADPQNLKNSTQHEQAVKRLVEWTMNKQI